MYSQFSPNTIQNKNRNGGIYETERGESSSYRKPSVAWRFRALAVFPIVCLNTRIHITFKTTMESSLLAPGLGPMGLRGMKFAGLCEAPPPTVGATTRCVTFYLQRCEAYSLLNTSSNGPNAGVLTALRHGLREVRVQGGFTCHDMLPLADLLLVGSPVIQTGGGVLPAAAAAAAAAATRTGASSTPSPTSSPIEDEIALYDGWCAQAGTTRAEVTAAISQQTNMCVSREPIRTVMTVCTMFLPFRRPSLP
jgi:hypothetical protein